MGLCDFILPIKERKHRFDEYTDMAGLRTQDSEFFIQHKKYIKIILWLLHGSYSKGYLYRQLSYKYYISMFGDLH